jgi:hypothetical protein
MRGMRLRKIRSHLLTPPWISQQAFRLIRCLHHLGSPLCRLSLAGLIVHRLSRRPSNGWSLLRPEGMLPSPVWLHECFSSPISWSELHGVTEVKTPLFRMCFQSGSNSDRRLIRRIGAATEVEGSAMGLSFPYLPPARRPRLVEIEVA